MRSVNSKVYTKKYYLTDCSGYKEFKESNGRKLNTIFLDLIKYIEVNSSTKVLDIGCGRGEMVFYCASRGATAIGIDYAEAAIKLANNTRSKQPKIIQDRAKFIKMDAKILKFDKSSFDLIIMTGVVEHLYPEELDVVFHQIRRVLKPAGKLIINTAPNRIFNDIAYKYYCYPASTLLTSFWNKLTGSKYPNIAMPHDIRTESHQIMHINEPTFFSLYRLYKKFNFKGGIFSTNITVRKQILSTRDILFNLLVFLHPFSKKFPLNIIFGSDFISVLTKNK
ncbi:MAG: hypothetical protein COU25_00415 [Candidatus Levybacteria bacterium CG10_big_fil_rev_8_21_14_0_10_35_13]|nr:MAG: hypothetical protein COU25_00415 [Candidatus Levybacteria bacterium CG10_big_fil_rev_8_21_14_0_10_35_13]